MWPGGGAAGWGGPGPGWPRPGWPPTIPQWPRGPPGPPHPPGLNSQQTRASLQAMPHHQVDWAQLAQQWIRQQHEPAPSHGPAHAPAPAMSERCYAGPPGEEDRVEGGAGGGEDMELEEDETGSGWGGAAWPLGWGSEGSNSQGSPESGLEAGAGAGLLSRPSLLPRPPPGPLFPVTEPGRGVEEGEGSRSSPGFGPAPVGGQTTFGQFDQLNEAQRKKLPSWIRAGLEKMEKDKLKKEEEEQRKLRMESKRKARMEEANLGREPDKSKFDASSASDEETADEDLKQSNENIHDKNLTRKSRFKDKNLVNDLLSEGEEQENGTFDPPKDVIKTYLQSKSKEEILQEMSSQLRLMLTTLLMEVTDQEIQHVSAEVREAARVKPVAKPKLKTLLSGYGSSSESGSEQDPESDQELRESLTVKQKQFEKIHSKIVDYCKEETAAYKMRERNWLGVGDSNDPQLKHEGKSLRNGGKRSNSSDSNESSIKTKSQRKRKEENRSSDEKSSIASRSTSRSESITIKNKSKKKVRSRKDEKKDKKRRSSSRSKSRTRNHDKKEKKRRSRSRKRTRSRHKSRSRSRSMSKRSISRSRERKRRSRSRSRSRKWKKKRSRSKKRTISSSRSRSRSRSTKRKQNSKSRSRSRKRNRKSNRSINRRRSGSISRSKSRSTSKLREKKDKKKKRDSRSRSRSRRGRRKLRSKSMS